MNYTQDDVQPFWEPDKELHRRAGVKYKSVIKNHPYAACDSTPYELDAMYAFLGFWGYLDWPCTLHVFRDCSLFVFHTQDVEENKRIFRSHENLHH